MTRSSKPSKCSVFLAVLASALLTSAAWSGSARADEHVLVLLDTTGSMDEASIPGKTRMQVAKERMDAFLSTVPATRTEYALWFFHDSGYEAIYSFADHASATQINAEVQSAVPGGLTPLAHSVCAAVDELIGYLPGQFHSKRIYMATDGDENNTPRLDQCKGPDSATLYPNLEVGSWQWKVRNKACTGNADRPGPCQPIAPAGVTLVVDVDHLFDYVPVISAAEAYVREGGQPELAAAISQVSPGADAAFFTGLAAETGGQYISITPSTPPAQATPLAGDANLDGCVDIWDRLAVLQRFGEQVPPGTTVDFNRNGVVDEADLRTVLEHFGEGDCPPIQ